MPASSYAAVGAVWPGVLRSAGRTIVSFTGLSAPPSKGLSLLPPPDPGRSADLSFFSLEGRLSMSLQIWGSKVPSERTYSRETCVAERLLCTFKRLPGNQFFEDWVALI